MAQSFRELNFGSLKREQNLLNECTTSFKLPSEQETGTRISIYPHEVRYYPATSRTPSRPSDPPPTPSSRIANLILGFNVLIACTHYPSRYYPRYCFIAPVGGFSYANSGTTFFFRTEINFNLGIHLERPYRSLLRTQKSSSNRHKKKVNFRRRQIESRFSSAPLPLGGGRKNFFSCFTSAK